MGSLDGRILRFLRTHGHTPALERAIARFSALGEHGALWLMIGAAGAAIDRRRTERWLGGTGTVLGAYAVNTALKLAIRRRRPALADLPPLASTPTQLSFPSAHTATAFAGAAAYSRLGLPAGPLYALAGATALSRLYLGLHYPSDVIAGAVLGRAVATAAERTRRARAATGAYGGGVMSANGSSSANGVASAARWPGRSTAAWAGGPTAPRNGGTNGGGTESGPR